MEWIGIVFTGLALSGSVVAGAVVVGIRLGALATTVANLSEQVSQFVRARNGGTQCQRHEDAIDELRRDVANLKGA